MSLKFKLSVAAAALMASAALMSPGPANALVHYELNTVFNGATPTSTSPWMTADFSTVVLGTVTLTLTSSLEIASEFIQDLAFNVDPTILPSSLTIVQGVGNPANTGINKATQNAQNVQGGGAAGNGFDVEITWGTSAGVGRFDGTDVVVFTITGLNIDENSFNFLNTGSSSSHVGAHIQGIPDSPTACEAVPCTTSGAVDDGIPPPPPIGAPEPGTLALLGFGLAGLGFYRNRRRSA